MLQQISDALEEEKSGLQHEAAEPVGITVLQHVVNSNVARNKLLEEISGRILSIGLNWD